MEKHYCKGNDRHRITKYNKKGYHRKVVPFFNCTAVPFYKDAIIITKLLEKNVEK